MLTESELKTRAIKLKIKSKATLYKEWAALAVLAQPTEEQFLEFHVLNEEVYRRKQHMIFARKLAVECFRQGKAKGVQIATVADVQEMCDG